MLCLSFAYAASAAVSDEPGAAAPKEEENAVVSEEPDSSASDDAEESAPEETAAGEEASEEDASDDAKAEEPDADGAEEDEPVKDRDSNVVVGSGLSSGAATDDTAAGALDLTVYGDGVLDVREGDEWIQLADWEKDAVLPQEDVEFRAEAVREGEPLTGVMVDGKLVGFEESEDEENAWLFSIPELTEETKIIVSFGDIIPCTVTMYGPGSVRVLGDAEGSEWIDITDEEPEFEAAVGEKLRILCTSGQTGYICTFLSVGDGTAEPKAFTTEGTVFEIEAKAPITQIAARFLAYDEIDVVKEGEGKIYWQNEDGGWTEIEDDARFPYDPESVSEQKPLTFKAVPEEGSQVPVVRFQDIELVVTEAPEEPQATASPEASASAEASGQPQQPGFLFTIPNPEKNGKLNVRFASSGSGSEIEWCRGSDSATGISWAVPMGTSVYGESNVTEGSKIQITRLTSGSAYEQARTLAARFGSQFTAWDFTLVNAQGVSYTPNVPVLFSLPIPSGYPQDLQYLRMLHILPDGQFMENTIELRQDPSTGMRYLYMRTDSLSTFILVNTASATGTPTPTPVPTYSYATATPVPTYAATAAPTPTPVPTAPVTGDPAMDEGWLTILAMLASAAFMMGAYALYRRNTKEQ